MKPVLKIGSHRKILQIVSIFIVVLVMFFMPATSLAQTDSTLTDTSTTVPADVKEVEEESSLISPSLEFITLQKANNTIDLKASLKAKIKGTFYNLPLLKISFVQVLETEEKNLGFVITDKTGKAVFTIRADSLSPDKEGKLLFKAVYAGNKQLEAVEEEVIIKRARLQVIPLQKDSVFSLSLKLTDIGTGLEIPILETVIGLYVKRMFQPLKLVEGTTDESGEATVEIPPNLPADAAGNMTLVARVDENETYGNLEAVIVEKWGIAVSDKIKDQPRTLWSSDPPIWMMVTFILLMAIVWGHYVVIIYQLFRLRKEEPQVINITL